jgi:hypothetical protein
MAMKEFDWHKELLPAHGADTYASCEELYQAIKARLVEECGIPRWKEPSLTERVMQMRED